MTLADELAEEFVEIEFTQLPGTDKDIPYADIANNPKIKGWELENYFKQHGIAEFYIVAKGGSMLDAVPTIKRLWEQYGLTPENAVAFYVGHVFARDGVPPREEHHSWWVVYKPTTQKQ